MRNGVEILGPSIAPDPGGIWICWSGGPVSCANLYGDDEARSDAVTAFEGSYDPRDPWLRRVDAEDVTFPLADQPGHGCTAVLRRQPPHIVDGRGEVGHTGAFEIICGDCGGNPYLDYSQVSPSRRKIRGPYAIAAGLAACEKHLGLTALRRRSCPARRGSSAPRAGTRHDAHKRRGVAAGLTCRTGREGALTNTRR